jgi:hypothetical protein
MGVLQNGRDVLPVGVQEGLDPRAPGRFALAHGHGNAKAHLHAVLCLAQRLHGQFAGWSPT